MRLRATLQHLLVHSSPALCKDKGHSASPTDMGLAEYSERKLVGATNTLHRANTDVTKYGDTETVFAANSPPPRPRFRSNPLLAPATALSCPEVFAEPFEEHNIDHLSLQHYLVSVESDLFRQSRAIAVRAVGLKPGLFSRYTLKDKGVLGWLAHIDSYLAEMMRLEGRGRYIDDKCGGCREVLRHGLGLRCDDCHDRGLYCLACCVINHLRHPFHRIQVRLRRFLAARPPLKRNVAEVDRKSVRKGRTERVGFPCPVRAQRWREMPLTRNRLNRVACCA